MYSKEFVVIRNRDYSKENWPDFYEVWLTQPVLGTRIERFGIYSNKREAKKVRDKLQSYMDFLNDSSTIH